MIILRIRVLNPPANQYLLFVPCMWQVYPTSTRSTGLGIANSFARVGGIVCPLVAVDLVRSCQQGLAVSVFAAVPLFAAVAVLFFPMETTGQPLSDVVDRSPAVGRK
jgi:hypothetical protein